jgi:glycosyltransferase involved in cell wall biosynthesis
MEAALQLLNQKNIDDIEGVIFGSNFNQEIVNKIPFPVHFVGHLNDEYSMALLYNSVDVYVTPSLAEAFGQTCLEAMACGIPVVGFNVGGIPDMIEHEKNGYLAEYKNSNDLANGVDHVLCKWNYKQISQHAIEKVNNYFSEQSVISQHIRLLNTIK